MKLSTMSNYDRQKIPEILAGEGTWFGAHLLRLIAKADQNNIELIRKGFPDQVKAVEDYRTSNN